MLISFEWLKQFVDLPDSTTPEEVAEKLKMSTVEVEAIVRQGAGLDGVVVGEVLEFKKHKNADKLHVAKVDVGEDAPRQIVFGQMVKMEVGFKVPVAKAPTILPGNKEIKVGEIRGELSEGMLCLDQELGLATEGVSIRFFDAKVKNGTLVTAALDLTDAILEIDNKSLSNRPDLWGHYGLAREVAALFNRSVKPYPTKKITPSKATKLSAEVVDPKFCTKTMFVALKNITVGPSPEWLQKRLRAVGQRPINNIVDITNYIMFDIGKPMHAFDARALESGPKGLRVIVRPAAPGEKLELLDGKTIELTPEHTVIASPSRALSLAGIMGGAGSGVTDKTTSIVFETAIFDAASIRRTAQALAVRSDSSVRFEKSLDPNLCVLSLEKAVELVRECCPAAEVASNVVETGKSKAAAPLIEMPKTIFSQKLGVAIPLKNITTILELLGFSVTDKKDNLLVKIPSWRATKDVSVPEDIVEEVARIYGYEHIPSSLPVRRGPPPVVTSASALEQTVADTLARELGFTEVYNYSFVSGRQIEIFGDNEEEYLELDNPLSKEKPYIRRHLIMNILENVVANIAGRASLKIFEIGKCYTKENPGLRVSDKSDELLPRQDTKITAVCVERKNQEPFWLARRALERLAEVLRLPITFAPESAGPLHAWMHPARTAWLMLGESVVGTVFEIHPEVTARLGIGERAGVCSLNLSVLESVGPEFQKSAHYTPLSLYPEVLRDIAFVVKKNLTHEAVMAALAGSDPLLKKVELFDVFTSQLGAGYKSVAYHLTFAHPDRTLTSAEVDKAFQKISSLLTKKFSADIRS